VWFFQKEMHLVERLTELGQDAASLMPEKIWC
jgi:hypothetical protein